MASFLHIYVTPRPGVSQADVENKINQALDWIRYSNGLYIVYTTSDVNKWQERLSRLVKPGGNLFICEINVKVRQGWMSKAFWEWIKKSR